MPGTELEMGLNSPRISGGADGFMSQMSSWLGPPWRRSKTIDFGRRAMDSARSAAGIVNPKRPNPPSWSHSRRVGPRAIGLSRTRNIRNHSGRKTLILKAEQRMAASGRYKLAQDQGYGMGWKR